MSVGRTSLMPDIANIRPHRGSGSGSCYFDTVSQIRTGASCRRLVLVYQTRQQDPNRTGRRLVTSVYYTKHASVRLEQGLVS